jgi:hypothetical protein
MKEIDLLKEQNELLKQELQLLKAQNKMSKVTIDFSKLNPGEASLFYIKARLYGFLYIFIFTIILFFILDIIN